MLDMGAWLYLFTTLPATLYLGLIPYWLRGCGVGAMVKMLLGYIITTVFLFGASILFILMYSECLENCYATKRDEFAMTISGLIICLYLVLVYKGCQSYQRARA